MKRIVYIGALMLAVMAGVILIEPVINNRGTEAVSGEADAKERVKLIIDAGHGGADGGATSDRGARESEINLDIAQKMEILAVFLGEQVAMTRETEEIAYSEEARTIHEKKVEDIKSRVRKINTYENAVLISIHQNRYTTPDPYGAQALYAPTEGSKELAEELQGALIRSLNEKNYRVAAQIPSNIYLMNKVNCPAVLIECGFLSNPKEEEMLLTSEYRLKVAAAIIAGYKSSQGG